jgi:hypothetical protein
MRCAESSEYDDDVECLVAWVLSAWLLGRNGIRFAVVDDYVERTSPHVGIHRRWLEAVRALDPEIEAAHWELLRTEWDPVIQGPIEESDPLWALKHLCIFVGAQTYVTQHRVDPTFGAHEEQTSSDAEL